MSRLVYWAGGLLASLYGHWRFDETSGTRYRREGTGPNLTESGGTISSATGWSGLAITGTEADTFSLQATLSPALAMSSGLSLAFWFKWPASPSLSPSTMFTLLDSGTNDYIQVIRYYNSNYLDVGFQWAVGQSVTLPLPRMGAFDIDEWHLLIVTYNTTTGVLTAMVDEGCLEDAAEWSSGTAYKLSVTVPAAQLSAANATTFDTLKFLKALSGSYVNFEGQIDEPGIWTKTLSGAETEQLWLGLTVTENQLYERLVQEDLNVGTDLTWITAPGGGELRATQVGIHSVARDQIATTATWAPGSIAAGSKASTTVTILDLAEGDFIMASHDKILTNDLQITGHYSAGNTVRVVIHNPTSAAITVPSGTLKVIALPSVTGSNLVASFSAVQIEGGIVGEAIVACTDASSGGSTPYTYAWTFGDGSGTSTDPNPQYTYSQGGGALTQTFTITLTLTDDASFVDTFTVDVTVTFNS